jgi:chromosomal replication initiator protein
MRAALATADRQVIQLMVARMALRSPRPIGGRVRVTDIIDQVCYEMGLHRCDVCGTGRAARLFRARAAICWLSRRLTPLSYPHIGARLGGRDHSSVMGACRRAADMRDRDPAFSRLTNRMLTHFRDLQED